METLASLLHVTTHSMFTLGLLYATLAVTTLAIVTILID